MDSIAPVQCEVGTLLLYTVWWRRGEGTKERREKSKVFSSSSILLSYICRMYLFFSSTMSETEERQRGEEAAKLVSLFCPLRPLSFKGMSSALKASQRLKQPLDPVNKIKGWKDLTLKQTCCKECPAAPLAFKDSMIH